MCLSIYRHFDTQPQEVPILAVIIEWYFLHYNMIGGHYAELCPKEKVIQLATLFLNNGYTPFKVDDNRLQLKRLDTTNFGVDWKMMNVAWLSNSIALFH